MTSSASLVWRDLLIVTRSAAFWVAGVVRLGWLGAFVLIWIDGVPALAGSPLAQALAVDWALLVVLLPWVAARCGSTQSWRYDLVRSALATGRPVSALVTARWVASSLALAGLCAIGLPAVLVAAQAADAGYEAVGWGLVPALGLCGAASATTIVAMVAVDSRLTGWLLSSAALWLGVAVNPGGWVGAVFALVLLAVALWATVAALSRTGPYLPDDD